VPRAASCQPINATNGLPEHHHGLGSLVEAFDAASRAGKYYVSFNVNSKNCMESSTGTRAFIAECRRQLERCVAHATNVRPERPRLARHGARGRPRERYQPIAIDSSNGTQVSANP